MTGSVGYVIDASVLIAAVVDQGVEGHWAEELIATAADLVAPHHALVEATNILRRLERARQLSSAEAARAQADLMQLDLILFPFRPFEKRIWELRHTLTSYDGWYIAVAEALDLPLATLDRRLARASGPSCLFVLPEPGN